MNLLKTLATISGMTMLSRITGLIRDTLIAHTFGTSAFMDAYNVAFTIPNLLRRLFAEGAFSQAFVPILAEYKNKEGPEKTKQLIDHVATTLIWATLITCAMGIAASPIVVYLFASGLAKNPAAFEVSVAMTQIMFPYITFMAFVAFASGILNTWREFKVPAFTPVLLNLSTIAAALFLAPYLPQPIYALGIAVFVGGVLQVAIQIPALVKIGMLPHIALNPLIGLRDSGVLRVLKKMGPAVFAVSAGQISIIINTSIGSYLPTGSISSLRYADRLMEFPTALLGVALGTILLPSLSKANVDGDKIEYSALLDWGLRLTFLLALPAAVGLATLSTPLTATLFHHGAFNVQAVAMTAQCLVAYGVGLTGIILVKILAPAFYAKQDIRTPVKIAVGVLVATQCMNLIFVGRLGLAVAGLALSVGLGACLNAGILFWSLRRREIYVPHNAWLPFFIKLAIALTLMAGVALWFSSYIPWTEMREHQLWRIGALFFILAACIATYFFALFVMGFRLKDFKRVAF